MAAACNRLVGLASGYFLEPETCLELRDVYRRFLDDGSSTRSWPPPSDMRTSRPVAEFRDLFEDAFKDAFSSESSRWPRLARGCSPTFRASCSRRWLDFVEAAALHPEGVAMSEHFLFVGRPRQA